MDGWIKIHRKIINNWIWDNSEYLRAWIYILITVNIEDKEVLISGELIKCSRGQSINSLQKWANLFGKNWSIQRVRTFFDLLKNQQMINTEGLHKTTRLTVCKYDDYQISATGKEQAKVSRINKQRTTTKEYKEYKEIPPKGGAGGEDIKNWKNDYETYLKELRIKFKEIVNDKDWITQQSRLNPNIDVQKSMEKACVNFWGTEAGWKHKKKDGTESINWKSTLGRSITVNGNKVYKDKIKSHD